MIFRSTRTSLVTYSFFDILLRGMPLDGGLFMFDSVPNLDMSKLLMLEQYSQFFYFIFIKFLTKSERQMLDFSLLIKRAYSTNNFYYHRYFKDVLYLTKFRFRATEGFLLDLSVGKTFSFKDFAIAFVAELLNSYLLSISATINVMVATSGDTGGSCEFYLRTSAFVKVFCFSPAGLISGFQALQMYSLHCFNIFNLKIKGAFDNCQSLLKSFVSKYSYFTTLNSVNLVRVLAQIVYYFRCYYHLRTYFGVLTKFIIVVPTGNFGNVYAAYLAYKMGLPIKQLILVNNENSTCFNIFNSFSFNLYSFVSTNSPSMDVTIPSNLERYLYFKLNSTDFYVYLQFLNVGVSSVIPFSNKSIVGFQCFDYERNFLCALFKRSGVYLDPHTANAVSFLLKVKHCFSLPVVCVSTAKYFKFYDKLTVLRTVKPLKVLHMLEIQRPRSFEFQAYDYLKILRFVFLNAFKCTNSG